MGWLGSLRTSRQVKDTLAALDAFDEDFDDDAAWDLLKPAVAKAVRENEQVVRSKILRDGMLPREIVLTVAANVALNVLSTGEHHIYRNRLSMTGNSYRTIFSKIVNLQKSLGTISEEERNQALLNMADAVAEAG